MKAQLKLLYSNDPLFTFVPENEVVEVEVTKLIYPSTLKSSETGAMDGTGYTPKTAIPKLNVTAARGIDYTTSGGGVATLLVSLTEQPTGIVKFAVAVSDKSVAELNLGKSPLLVFTPTNYAGLEVEVWARRQPQVDGDKAFACSSASWSPTTRASRAATTCRTSRTA